VAQFTGNHIYNNNLGVLLYNNSNTAFGTVSNPPIVDQIIEDNASFEFYASANSFPALFRYNQIIDEDNLGNSKNDPLLYLKPILVPTPSFTPKDITLNYWGVNFDYRENLYPHALFVNGERTDTKKMVVK